MGVLVPLLWCCHLVHRCLYGRRPPNFFALQAPFPRSFAFQASTNVLEAYNPPPISSCCKSSHSGHIHHRIHYVACPPTHTSRKISSTVSNILCFSGSMFYRVVLQSASLSKDLYRPICISDLPRRCSSFRFRVLWLHALWSSIACRR
ncbi:hypothetical protein B0H15DRAFT_162130 [Mycena belliarum]|uniref:Secreted protein n=1 Tax=Mycena belliarum TaxID=1033014 RepID=A0AAD6XWE9_9AGAR|nr:hypothetical protein B0H15DRAFT_162130 [Mycena belliae]